MSLLSSRVPYTWEGAVKNNNISECIADTLGARDYLLMTKALRTNRVLSKINIYIAKKGYSSIHPDSWGLEGNVVTQHFQPWLRFRIIWGPPIYLPIYIGNLLKTCQSPIPDQLE